MTVLVLMVILGMAVLIGLICLILAFFLYRYWKDKGRRDAARASQQSDSALLDFEDADPDSPLHSILKSHLLSYTHLKKLGGEGDASVYCFLISGKEAIQTWESFRGVVESTGYWPLLLGAPSMNNLSLLQEGLEDGGAEPEPEPHFFEKADALDMQTWWVKRTQSLFGGTDPFLDIVRGQWPESTQFHESNHKFLIHTDLMGMKPLHKVVMALIPTRTFWEAPAFMKYGGWNDCPSPHEHIAVMKYWQERYGAELVGMASDIIEMKVARPPQDRESALALAKEQFIYCPDLVYQGTETLEGLAATLLNGSVWYFWWD